MRRVEAEETVTIPIGTVKLNGDLSVPSGARGLVLFRNGETCLPMKVTIYAGGVVSKFD